MIVTFILCEYHQWKCKESGLFWRRDVGIQRFQQLFEEFMTSIPTIFL